MKGDYENVKTKRDGVYYTRYIASWINEGGYDKYGFEDPFASWLYSEGLTDFEIADVIFLAKNGRFELERSVRKFLDEYQKQEAT